MKKTTKQYINGEYVEVEIEVEEDPQPQPQSDAERITELEKRQDIADTALEELISMVLEV